MGYDDIDSWFDRPSDEAINAFRQSNQELPDWALLKKQYEESEHVIVHDRVGRKDKVRKDGIERASRIHIGLEKLLVNRMTEFMFAIPVRRIYSNVNDKDISAVTRAIDSIYKHARIDRENLRRAKYYFAACEFVTIWYTVQSPNSLYGFNSQYKLKCRSYSPMDGCSIYPVFNEYDDLVAISIEQTHTLSNTEEMYVFETYTSQRHVRWVRQRGTDLKKDVDEKISLMKIPAVYGYRKTPIFHGVSHLREEIEYTLSRNSDVIAYNSAPILKVSGSIQGQEVKGESRRIMRVENGGDISYVSWGQSIEALKFQVDTLLKLFWQQSQMPDISFENMKGLGNIGYDARKTLLSDAHLKVGEESGAWIEYLEREFNVIKAFLAQLNTGWASLMDSVECEHVITPFVQDDEAAEISKWSTYCGGKAVGSQIDAIRQLGISTDPERTLNEIRQEEAASAANAMASAFGGV